MLGFRQLEDIFDRFSRTHSTRPGNCANGDSDGRWVFGFECFVEVGCDHLGTVEIFGCIERFCLGHFQSQRAAVIIDVAFTKRTDGRVLQMPSGIFFTLRRGLITELRSFFDTIDMIEQLTGRDLIGPLLRETGPGLRPPPAEPSCQER